VRKNSADAEVMDVATVRAKAENFIVIFGYYKIVGSVQDNNIII
jgi:hypothetical protein